MSDDKLVKTGSSVETADALAAKILRAVADNDIESANKLADELREKRERCSAENSNWLNQTMRCVRPAGHQSEHCSEVGDRKYFWNNPEWSQSDKLANVSKQPVSTVPSLFDEGKHFCKLRRVYYETSRTGNPMVCFVLEVVKSQQIATGVEVVHALPVRTPTMTNIVRGQLDRLGIDPSAINGMLDSLDIKVVMVVVKKWTKAKIDGSQREVTSWWMRRPDESDVETDFE